MTIKPRERDDGDIDPTETLKGFLASCEDFAKAGTDMEGLRMAHQDALDLLDELYEWLEDGGCLPNATKAARDFLWKTRNATVERAMEGSTR